MTRCRAAGGWFGPAVLAGVVAAFVATALVQAWRDSATVDEVVDISAGVAGLVRHDLRLNPEHDVVVHVAAGLPALLAHPVVPSGAAYARDDWFGYADDFVRANVRAGRWHRILFLARLSGIIDSLGAAVGMGATAWLLRCRWAVWSAPALWLSLPAVAGYGHFVGIDMAFTLATVGVVATLVAYHRHPRTRWLLALGAALGMALLTRHLAVLFALGVALAVWREARGSGAVARVKKVGAALAVAWLAVWACVAALGSGNDLGEVRYGDLIGAGRASSVGVRLILAVPWPAQWSAGLAYLALTSKVHAAYLLGRTWTGGRWWFFPLTLVVKAPLLALIFAIGALLVWRVRRRSTAVQLGSAVVLLIMPFLGYLAAQPLDLGFRYALGMVAVGTLLGAVVIERAGSATARKLAAAAIPLQLVAAAVAYPHSLAWNFPPFRPSYRYVSDSSVDYGQDNEALARRLAREPALVDLLLPRGIDDPVGTRRLTEVPFSSIRGLVAVSATRLTELDAKRLSWLRAYCSVGTVGGSIVLYRFDEPPDSAPGPVTPRGSCRGTASIRQARR